MTTLNLEALGITKEDLENRIVERAARELLTGISVDEDGEEWRVSNGLARKLDAMIKQRIDETVGALAEQHVLPNVASYIENLTLQKTNQWGERVEQKLTFIEYLTQRAETYLTEHVNYEGKGEAESRSQGYSWSKSQTRIAHMVDKHLHYSIETAMKDAVSTANSAIVNGIAETVKIKLAEVAAKLKVTTKI